jgi:D-glycero-D-manno-heptose 1,7-bisphosphate phosphatase
MHAQLRKNLHIDAVKVCFHGDESKCECRKPKPGMLLEAARELGIDLHRSFMVGDRWRDVGAAHAAGCEALFLDYRYDEKRPEKPYLAVKSLSDAAEVILSSTAK